MTKAKKPEVSVVVSASDVVAALVATVDSKGRADSVGAKFTAALTAYYVANSHNDAEFFAAFGNGKNGKERTAGALRTAADAKIAKFAKDRREAVELMLRVRLSEARKLFRLGGMPADGEAIQTAVKRYAKPAAKPARPEGNEKAETFSIPEEMSAHDVAEAFSKWMAAQTAAKVKAFSVEMADMLKPATPAKAKKTA